MHQRPDRQALDLFLRRLLLRSPLGLAERDAVLALPATPVSVKGRFDILHPGETTDHACLVADGLLGRFDQMADGGRQTSSLYLPGDMCDLMSVVLPTSGWGIAALSAATVIQVPHAALREAALRHPALAFAFWQDTAVDAAHLAKWVSIIGRSDARTRVAHLFCEIGHRSEQAALGTRAAFRFPITQEQLGETLGLTGIHVNRVLRLLREEGLVEFRSGFVRVTDRARLERAAEFDPAFLLLPEPGPAVAPALPHQLVPQH